MYDQPTAAMQDEQEPLLNRFHHTFENEVAEIQILKVSIQRLLLLIVDNQAPERCVNPEHEMPYNPNMVEKLHSTLGNLQNIRYDLQSINNQLHTLIG